MSSRQEPDVNNPHVTPCLRGDDQVPQQQQQQQRQQQQVAYSHLTTSISGEREQQLSATFSSPSTRRGTAVPSHSDIVDLTLSVVGDDTQGHEDVTGQYPQLEIRKTLCTHLKRIFAALMLVISVNAAFIRPFSIVCARFNPARLASSYSKVDHHIHLA